MVKSSSRRGLEIQGKKVGSGKKKGNYNGTCMKNICLETYDVT